MSKCIRAILGIQIFLETYTVTKRMRNNYIMQNVWLSSFFYKILGHRYDNNNEYDVNRYYGNDHEID